MLRCFTADTFQGHRRRHQIGFLLLYAPHLAIKYQSLALIFLILIIFLFFLFSFPRFADELSLLVELDGAKVSVMVPRHEKRSTSYLDMEQFLIEGYYVCPSENCDRKWVCCANACEFQANRPPPVSRYQVKHSLSRHMRHECTQSRRFGCPDCTRTFTHGFNVIRHLQQVHKMSSNDAHQRYTKYSRWKSWKWTKYLFLNKELLRIWKLFLVIAVLSR